MSQQVNAKFIRVAKNPTCNMMKVVVNGKEQWADCPQNVKNFAEKAFGEGQDVVLTADFVNNRYNVSRIEQAGGYQQPPQQPTQQAPAYQQAVQQPTQQFTPPTAGNLEMPRKYRDPVTPDEAERMCRLSVLASVCESVSALTGQVDANVLPDVIEATYDRLLNKVKNG